jgi:hypothetical protein
MRAPHGGPLPAPMSGSYRCYNPSVLALLLAPVGTLVAGRFTRIWVFRFCRPHQGPDCQLELKVSWREESPSAATRQILMLTEGWPRRLTRKPRAAGASRPVEATVRNGQIDLTNRVRRWSADRLSDTLTEGFSSFFLSCKANAGVYNAKSGHGTHSPPSGAVASPKRLTKVAFFEVATESVWAQNPDSQPIQSASPHN